MGDYREPVDEAAPGSSPSGNEDPGVIAPVESLRRWTAEEKAQVLFPPLAG